ncbi:MAG: hypothetical protein IT437_00145 [Phycisphaerales bacterium]|nr:hypothetical protein [Phycisphaerales bacterium]
MSARRKQALRIVGALVVLGAGYVSYSWLYAGPRDAILGRLAEDRDAIERYGTALKQRTAVNTGLKAAGARTLGATEEEADAAFRDHLFAVASKCGLSGVEVTSTSPLPVHNPVGDSGIRSATARELKKQVDFRTLGGTVSGKGSLDEVMRAAATLDAQPWAHRLTTILVKPADKEHQRFEVMLGVQGVLAPDLYTPPAAEADVTLLGDAAGQKWAALVSKNVFRLPPPDAPPKPPVQAEAPRSPYADWRMTGVVESRLGTEVWLVNDRSKERLSLAVGSQVADAKLVSGAGESAVFEIAGQRYEVSNGQTLEDRRPVN